MKKTIYNVSVLMEDQAQCDRMKQLCLDNGLPIWDEEIAFDYNVEYPKDKRDKAFFGFFGYEFYVVVTSLTTEKKLVTESEFIELLKNHKG